MAQPVMTIEAKLPCDHPTDDYKVGLGVEGNAFSRRTYMYLECTRCKARTEFEPHAIAVVLKRVK
jgi:hypothetical protein